MAARINPAHDARTRAKIQTSQLLNRLEKFALGDDSVEMDTNRLRAVEILLRKTLPDLSSVSIAAPDGGPVQIETLRRVIHDPKA